MKAFRYFLPIAILIFGVLFFLSRSRQTSEKLTLPPALVAQEDKAMAERLLSNLTTIYQQATKALEAVQDDTSAGAASTQLQALGTEIEKAQAVWNQAPESFRPKLRPVAAEGYKKLQAAIERALTIPGAIEKLKPATDQLLAKLKFFS